MPEHFHLLISEPEVGTPSTVMQVLKQRTARALLPKRKRVDRRQTLLFGETTRAGFWQARFYVFNVWTTKKRPEKLRYMHRNPVKRGLVSSPATAWSWGYNMRLTVNSIDERHARAIVGISRSGGKAVSWGSGKKEVHKILAGIDAELASRKAGLR